jgi:hypothetical protein
MINPPVTEFPQCANSHREHEAAALIQAQPRSLFARLALALPLLVQMPAHAADGCQVLLCLAAPSWRSVPQCVPPVRQVLHDLARGKPFPVCNMTGAGNSANHEWAAAPVFCPPQYSHLVHSESGPIHICDYTGAVTVTVNSALFTRTWWTMEGDSVTEFSPAAKAQLGTWDRRFDDEYAAWLASLPPPAAPIDSGY